MSRGLPKFVNMLDKAISPTGVSKRVVSMGLVRGGWSGGSRTVSCRRPMP